MKRKLLVAFALLPLLGGLAWLTWRPSARVAAEARWVCPMRCLNRTYARAGKCPVCHMDLVPFRETAAEPKVDAGGASFSVHGHAPRGGHAPKPLGYRCPLRYSKIRFDAPGRCPFCTLPLKPIYAPGEEPPRESVNVEAWPLVGGRSSIYYRSYIIRPTALERLLRLAGRVSADGWTLRASLPVGAEAPAKGAFAMLSAAGGGRPVLASVESVEGRRVGLRSSRRLLGVSAATAEVRLPGKSVLAVPLEAVTESGGRAWVFLRHAARFEPVPVVLGRRGERYLEVARGLREGDEVAASGLFWIEAQWRLDHPGQAL